MRVAQILIHAGLEQFLAQVLAFEPLTLLPVIFAPEQGASPMAVP